MADRRVAVELVARVQSYRAQIGTAIASTREFRGELDNMRRNSASNFHQVQTAAAGAGLAMVALAGWATKVGMEFDKQMSEVQAITNATAADLGNLRQAALDAGKATVFSATDAAKAEAELAKAGLTTSDILGGALAGSLALASAGSLDLAEAASIAAKTMGQFGLKGKDVSQIADLLAGAANASATDVHELGEALKMGGGAAHAAGMSVEDTTTVLTAFAKQALVGSDAGTSFKTMLMMLEAPTEKARKKMDELGLDMYDANGNMVDAYEIAGQLQSALGGLTQEQRNAAVVTIFGADAQRAANALYAVGKDGLHKLNGEMLAQADAARVAAQKTDNLSGDLERLKGSLETLAIDSQSGAAGGLRFLVESLDALVGRFEALPKGVGTAIVILAGLSGGALLAAVAFLKVRGAVTDVLENLAAVGPTSAKAAKGLSVAASAASKAMIVFAALQIVTAAGEAIIGHLDANANEAAKALDTWTASTLASGEAARLFGDDLGELADGLKRASVPANGFDKAMDDIGPALLMAEHSIGNGTERIKAFDETLTKLVQNHQGDLALQLLAAAAAKAGISIDQVKAQLPQYTQAADDAAAATGDVASQTTALNRAQLAAVESGKTLIDVWDELHGKVKSADEAMLAAIEATNAVKEAFKENGRAIDGDSEAALKNRLALEKQARAAYEAADAYLANGGSAEGAQKILDGFKKSAQDSAVAAGANKDAVKALNDELYRMPPTVTTTLNVITRNITEYQTYRAGERNTSGHANGGIVQFAQGGMYESHLAQIASPGETRMWNEPETGGEAYIPLGAQKRSRSLAVLGEVNRRFGYPLSGAGGGGRQQIDVQVTVKDTSGRTLRTELINDALNRGQASSVVATAYP